MNEGDTAFESWYRDLHGGLVGSLAVAFGDLDLAREAADEAVARAYERWDRVSAMASPAGWTYRVAVNVARRRQRRRTAERRLLRRETVEPMPGPAGELWQIVADLPERQRLAVVLRHVAGLTEADIGESMGITRGTVSATLRHAYAALRLEIEHDQVTFAAARETTT